MSMVTPNLDYISLDSEDSGIQWIPGVGFRPVDMTEELPFFRQMDCDIIDTGTQCEMGDCSFGKGSGVSSGKFDLVVVIPPIHEPKDPTYVPPYNPPIYATPDDPVTGGGIPPWKPWNPTPPSSDCCVTATPPPSDPPPIPIIPPVPLADTGLFLLTALAAVAIIWRFS